MGAKRPKSLIFIIVACMQVINTQISIPMQTETHKEFKFEGSVRERQNEVEE